VSAGAGAGGAEKDSKGPEGKKLGSLIGRKRKMRKNKRG
jgi:hypothetical protein